MIRLIWNLKQCRQTFRISNRADKLLEFLTAHFLFLTETERTFVVSIIYLSFIKYSIAWKNSSLLLWQQYWRLFLSTWFSYSNGVEKAKAKLSENRWLDIDCFQLLENNAQVFCCNASTVSCLELTLVDPLVKWKKFFVWYRT